MCILNIIFMYYILHIVCIYDLHADTQANMDFDELRYPYSLLQSNACKGTMGNLCKQ